MTQERYNPQEIEIKWQKRWAESKAFACSNTSDKPKYYVLEMFPYPSGNLHMGHVRNYSIGDVLARAKRMQGFNVLHPIGWDAFGLPAENAAIKHNTHPADWTYANIDNMRAQLKRLGYSYDWDREVATCDEPYYRWEQLFFLRWLEKGLVYRKKASQNWCPHCNTVLANEQVVDGLCWRCDTPVVQKELTQWFLKITDYADELLADLSKLEGGWPDRVLSMQRNWIGKSVGAEITFPLESGEGDIKVFTTRPDTVFGVTFMTLAPEHPLVDSLISGKPNEAEARAFIERIHNMDRIDRQSDSLEKEGVFTGAYCLNPFTGRQVPIWLGNFVLAEYGTGAVMAVPAHDQRDFDFSKKYGMERIVVIQPEGEAPLTPESLTEAYTAPGVLVNSGEFNGLHNEEAKKAIADALEASGKGKRTTNWRLRDWNISRQRYWGAPIPVIYCDKCGMVPVPEDQLPVRLPLDVQTHPDGKSPLPHTPEFYNCTCPKCGGAAKRETDTMDTFVESSWYFARYTDARNGKFRTDLFARINLWYFRLPSLRERPEDIESNIDYELKRLSEQRGIFADFLPEARELYLDFARSPEAAWPGNFRTLSSSLERMHTYAFQGIITKETVEKEIAYLRSLWRRRMEKLEGVEFPLIARASHLIDRELDLFDKVQLEKVLEVCLSCNRRSEAGRLLFASSRLRKTSADDTARLNKYLRSFNLSWESVKSLEE